MRVAERGGEHGPERRTEHGPKSHEERRPERGGERQEGRSARPALRGAILAQGRVPAATILTSAGATRWYLGASIALFWLLSIGQAAAQRAPSPASAALAVALLVLFGAAFLLGAPLTWSLPPRLRLLVPAGLFALSFSLFPWVQWDVASMWTYAGVLVGMAVLPWRITWPVLLGLAALAVVVLGLSEGWTEDILWIPAIVLSISLMMAAFARTMATVAQLRETQAELELLAVERERHRVGRDLHDILGHSLTVITVKAELARRLLDADPERAREEIAEVEELARGALTDVRATVSGFRGVSISGELAAARAALTSAGITPDLPTSTEAIPTDRRELAGWVVREGVTNVIRHSNATRCRVSFRDGVIEVADDGIGPSGAGPGAGFGAGAGAGSGAGPGAGSAPEPRSGSASSSALTSNGLAGLRERVEAVGGRMSVGRSDLGGFALRVTL